MTVLNLDCRVGFSLFPDNSFDAIVTDPPYELGFMGKSWDASGIAYNADMWAEALRVLKPGGHLLAFSGSRTYHRMACAIEDAGFEVRDQVMWVYGSGFPKSLDVSKAIDKAAGAEREVIGRKSYGDGHVQNSGESIGYGGCDPEADKRAITAPATDAARQWEGWGTALKPAHEPICVARKPLSGTVAANVLAHGTGALNIDGCRVHSHDSAGYAYTAQRMAPGADQNATGKTHMVGVEYQGETKDGRWPANLIHDGSDEVLAGFPYTKSGGGDKASTGESENRSMSGKNYARERGTISAPDEGSAARFFYCAKASAKDRGAENVHPTVKPTDLMRYLVRLVTPPGGLVLDPFAGSGSTGKAAKLEGFRFCGFEMSAEYAAIANARIEAAQ